LDRALALVGGVWLINLVNFMDGIDWMTVAEIVPITAGLALFGLAGAVPASATLVAVVLCGAMIGFAPFNRPVAKLFLGNVGSLPIGLLLGWLLAMLAGNAHLVAAILFRFLSGGCDHHIGARTHEGRAAHTGASESFLSAGARQRIQCLPDRDPCIFLEPCPCRIG
jgi:UDP-N-acetylmuramyl pentapeptide phosphotransferase/UDP-N-acetylglucosamine-1-phosphate transferase